MIRSNGPDKLKSGYACYIHHSGARSFKEYNDLSVGSGNYKILMDYNCCCDPCLYYKSDFHQDGQWDHPQRNPNKEHCCSCNPKMLVVNWDPDNPEDLCDVYPQKEPVFYNSYPAVEGALSVKYEGSVVGHPVLITLSSYKTLPDGTFEVDNSGCRWTAHLATGSTFDGGYSTQVRFIDHNDVTCLGVPNFSFSGVTGFGGDGGTVTITNYDSAKVPFVARSFSGVPPISIISNIGDLSIIASGGSHVGIPDYNNIIGEYIYDPPISGLMVPLPSSIIGPPLMRSGYLGFEGQYPDGLLPLETECKHVPRFLCVKADRLYDVPDPPDLVKYREYVLDTGFYPIQRAEFHPDYTGIESFTTGKTLARWSYTPLNHTGVNQVPADETKKYLFLYETYTHNIPIFNGSGELAQTSGEPKYLLIPIEFNNDDPSSSDNVWIGGGFLYHPLIHGGSGIISFVEEGEEYYHNPGSDTTRCLYLGGAYSYGKAVYGSGENCTCNFSAFAGYDEDDYSDIRYVKTGRCSKWQYWCSDACRCVPRDICMLTAEVLRTPPSTNIIKRKLSWDGNSCWVGGSGDEEIRLCLVSKPEIGFLGEETWNGLCGLSLGGGFFASGAQHDYGFADQFPLTCSWVSMQKAFVSNIQESGKTIASMIAQTFPFFDDCYSRTSCDLASPCRANCGSHPDAISIYARVFSVSGEDESSGGFTPANECEETFELIYKEDIVISAEDPLSYYTLCYYEGYYACESSVVPIRAYLNGEGTWPFIEFNGFANDNSLYSPFSKLAFDSYTESCEPYFFSGVIREEGPFAPFWWKQPCNKEDNTCLGWRLEIVINEI